MPETATVIFWSLRAVSPSSASQGLSSVSQGQFMSPSRVSQGQFMSPSSVSQGQFMLGYAGLMNPPSINYSSIIGLS